ncbi:MAG: TRM11 family SAM-dependent methyltransferase [Candidatus Hodarchaeota archaeon]
MKQFLFVLGKNYLLSLCEISHLLQFAPYKGKIIDYSKQIGIIEFEEIIKPELLLKLQNRLGGIQKIGEIIDDYQKEIFIEGFPIQKHPKKFKKARKSIENDIIPKILPQIFLNVQNKKIMFAISVYPHLFSRPELSIGHLIQFLNEFIKEHLVKDSNSVKYFRYPGELLESKNLNPIWPHHVLIYSLLEFPNAEIIWGFTKDRCYIARTIAVDNPNLRKIIDEHRPKTQFEISMPPKLAKILINLLNLPKNGILLDPFCGTGTILMMAALQDINFYGTDIDNDQIEATTNNLNWLKREFDLDYQIDAKKVFTLDSMKLDSYFKENSIDGIATEPYLGPPLKSPLLRTEYQKIIDDEIKPLYEKSLHSMKKILKMNGNIAIISPVYKEIDNKLVDFNFSKIAKEIGLKIVKLMPLSRFSIQKEIKYNKNSLFIRKDQYVMRKINLFQKIE